MGMVYYSAQAKVDSAQVERYQQSLVEELTADNKI